MLTEADLERALAAAGLSAPVRADEVTGSTNETALAMAAEGTSEWTLVSAAHQTAGRGRLGRSWLDAGGSLLFSVVLRPQLSPQAAGLLPLLAGAAMAEAIREGTDTHAGCKWPNDLLIGDHKVGGILGESVVENGVMLHVVIGIGVNLAGAPAGVQGAAALGEVDGGALLSGFLRRFVAVYAPADPAFPAEVLAAYRTVSLTIGRDVEATTVGGSRVIGRAMDVDERGGLIVGTPEGLRTVSHGEVAHLAR